MLSKNVLEINLGAINRNLSVIRNHVGSGIRILLPVKADAYGHGIIEVARAVEHSGNADMLGVASIDEGIELRDAGITLPILILSLIIPERESIEALFRYRLTQTIADLKLAEAISTAGAKNGNKLPIHVIVDTGMGRIGCRPDDASDLVAAVSELEGIVLEGLYTHFPDADGDDPAFTREQIAQFKEIVDQVEKMGIKIPLRHLANSAGIINFPDSYMDMVRPGILSYGYLPSYGMSCDLPVEPSMSLKSSIMFVKRVPKSTTISYGCTYTTSMETYIATVQIGYGDGYSRYLSNVGKVIIAGRQYPIAGRVTMDQIMVDLGNDRCEPGEEVILFGTKGITADVIAHWINTIPYEITCGISKRVPRRFLPAL